MAEKSRGKDRLIDSPEETQRPRESRRPMGRNKNGERNQEKETGDSQKSKMQKRRYRKQKRKSNVKKQHWEDDMGLYQAARLRAYGVVGLLSGALAGAAGVDSRLRAGAGGGGSGSLGAEGSRDSYRGRTQVPALPGVGREVV